MKDILKQAILNHQDVARDYPEWIIGLCANTIQFVGPEDTTWFHLNTYHMTDKTSVHFAKVVYKINRWELHFATHNGDVIKYELDVRRKN